MSRRSAVARRLSATAAGLTPSRLRRSDSVLLGVAGLRARPGRLVLSALGIAIGIAAMIAVVGISTSSRAALDAELDRLGTNLLRAVPDAQARTAVQLPEDSAARIDRLPGVERAAGYADLHTKLYRSALIDRAETGALTVGTADDALAPLLNASVAAGRWHDRASDGLGTVVLGSLAAERLGITGPGAQVLAGDTPVTVIGVLGPLPLAPDLDTSAFVDRTTARTIGWDGRPTILFERSTDEAVAALRDQVAGTLLPGSPGDVAISRPSDALAARDAADSAFSGMLVGLSGVALLVGGIGVANTMVIAVLERRREIGLRRALGATRRHVRTQFVVEALLLSFAGGVLGVGIGSGVVAAVAAGNGWAFVVPWSAFAIGLAATLAIGALAGAYPAMRAARTPPTVALAS
ncbi:ABC transporter permease [Curtobacterium sp. PhB136]|uniref:ABC transporter permease n=1 Tax=Curtobacterium sp. PhB136 TaxID=2485181 RepID=UPI001052FCC8|nr:ABC transporter permease [Curtobacterium sp. PhB136]TCK65640.1 putative ABC transport system permease protein [Curtobacterium sp. PhB136]